MTFIFNETKLFHNTFNVKTTEMVLHDVFIAITHKHWFPVLLWKYNCSHN